MNTASQPIAAPTVTRWTRIHILLHWTAAGLIALQFLTGDSMSSLFRANLAGGPVDDDGLRSALAPLHMAIGLTVFLAVALRVWDRFAHGRPPHPPGEPNWAQRLAAVTQFALYATVLSMPIAGAIAWFTGNGELGSLHALASKVLLGLVVLHSAGALANHYWFKTDVLVKMLPGHGRESGVATQEAAVVERR